MSSSVRCASRAHACHAASTAASATSAKSSSVAMSSLARTSGVSARDPGGGAACVRADQHDATREPRGGGHHVSSGKPKRRSRTDACRVLRAATRTCAPARPPNIIAQLRRPPGQRGAGAAPSALMGARARSDPTGLARCRAGVCRAALCRGCFAATRSDAAAPDTSADERRPEDARSAG
jgi:hypothetical protein